MGTLKITRVIVAHRPETIVSASRVIELVGGKVATMATREEYIARLRKQQIFGIEPAGRVPALA